MYAFNAAALLALIGAAAAKPTASPAPMPTGSKNGTVTVTSVVDVYTTYCPGPTSFHMGGKDYVVTKPTTLIITDCPCTVTETHPAGPTWIPGHPGYKPGHPVKPEHPENEKPGKPEHPVKPEHPENEKPGKPEHPVKPEHPEVEKPSKPEHPDVEKPEYPAKPEHPEVEKPAQPEHPTNPEKPEGEKPGKDEEVPEEPVVTAGAGAIQFGLGLATFLGLMAL
ncbi:hypothetical protein FVEN_g7359 [Fusarium venenatum]|uniref:Cell wall protein SED1 n=1 Tax=Fusarium venenatum TaxID=56646 RepID=A0A2L2U2G4_9HYPO|nr:uncharacterized protein FVRRES_09847 [Fusarium venenatum]KAG8354953.1 hypothetical protein FVEN_g7359 [Fusarium venenatum]KAH6966496.1 hypothetical protein EDB82DRAFT_334110 [Fusarium venenatum]CEI69770.1 unnamed protein product [Fusarium venenatum]